MANGALYTFVDGPRWIEDIGRIEIDHGAQDALECALENLLHAEGSDRVSHSLGPDTDLRYIRSREFPSLNMPPLYMIFRMERDGLIERRRIFTEADVRMPGWIDGPL